ncbi:MAG: Zn-dependent oligopeptidase [Deltaproteobacteria bacterium]|nr:Zn-dependent oligopeptidase [Deltaproteobacteria bacterium]
MKTTLMLLASLATLSTALAADPVYPKIKFTYSAQDIKVECAAALAKASRQVERLARLGDDQRTFTNTVVAFEKIQNAVDEQLGPILFLSSVSPSSAVLDASNDCGDKVSSFYVALSGRTDLYKAIDVVAHQDLRLDVEDAKLLEETVRGFKRSGASLPEDVRAQVTKLKDQLGLAQNAFSKNLAKANDTAELTKDELAGMNDDYISTLKATDKGTYLLTLLDASQFLPFMENGTNAEARKKVQTAHDKVAAPQNVALLEQAIALRDQIAKLSGFPTWAAYQLDAKMAKSPERVNEFLADLATRLAPKVDADLAGLLELKKKDEPSATKVYLWDWRYYDNQLKKSRAVDNEAIRAYFPVDKVITAVFDIYQRLLTVKFTEIVPAYAWAPEVRLFEVRDARAGNEGALIGHFYLDLYPRENKYKHFAAFDIIHARRNKDGSYHTPVSSVVGNFPKAAPGKPSLLLHSDVETFFHEFGHIMHQTLTDARYSSLAGTNVRGDYVEAPSQMLENWVWDRDEIKKISSHYKDGSQLPDTLIDSMLAAKHLDEGITWSRQLFFASFDMLAHSSGAAVDTTKLWNELSPRIYRMDSTEGNAAQASFGHLMGGYDAGYYGYLWSKVYAQDMFTVFQAAGLESPVAGDKYREWILRKGGVYEPDVLIRNFLGREPNKEAFYKSLGIGDTKPQPLGLLN